MTKDFARRDPRAVQGEIGIEAEYVSMATDCGNSPFTWQEAHDRITRVYPH
jgi:hypothetical protein